MCRNESSFHHCCIVLLLSCPDDLLPDAVPNSILFRGKFKNIGWKRKPDFAQLDLRERGKYRPARARAVFHVEIPEVLTISQECHYQYDLLLDLGQRNSCLRQVPLCLESRFIWCLESACDVYASETIVSPSVVTRILHLFACFLIALRLIFRLIINYVLQNQKIRRPETRHLPSRKSANIEYEERQASRDEQDPIQLLPRIHQYHSPG